MWNVRIFFPPDDITVMKEYEIITLKYDGKACRGNLFYCCVYNIHVTIHNLVANY